MPTTSVPMSAFQVNDYLNSIPNTPQGLNLLSQYVNNSNPQIPSWQALVRLNNIKQQEQAYKEFQAPTQQPTVKDQIQQSLSQQVNPAQPQQIQQMPQQAQQPAMMAAGGIASVPTANMFNAGSYAGGGIVAFVDNEDQPVSEDMPNKPALAKARGKRRSDSEESTADRMANSVGEGVSNVAKKLGSEDFWIPNYDTLPATVNQYDSGEQSPAVAAVVPTAQPAQQATPSVEQAVANASSSAPAAPRGPAAPTGIQTVAPRATQPQAQSGRPGQQNIDQIIAEREMLENRFGVSKDPYAAVKQRQTAIEARQNAKYAEDPTDRMIAQLGAFAKADPTKGFGYQMGAGAEASQLLKKEQTLYRDKAEEASVGFYSAMAKEEDAKKRGDVAGILAAKKDQEANQIKWYEADSKAKSAAADMIRAGAAGGTTASTNAYHQALIKKIESEIPTKEEAAKSRLDKDKSTIIANNPELKRASLFIKELMVPEDKEAWGNYATDYEAALRAGSPLPQKPKLQDVVISPGGFLSSPKTAKQYVYNPQTAAAPSAPSAPQAIRFDQLPK